MASSEEQGPLSHQFYVDDVEALDDAVGAEFLLLVPPAPAADYLQRNLSVYSLEQYRERLAEEARHGRWVAMLQRHSDRRIFFLSPGPPADRAEGIWAWQREVVGHRLEFTIEAVADCGRPRQPGAGEACASGGGASTWPEQCRAIYFPGVFAEGEEPAGVTQRQVAQNRVLLAVELDHAAVSAELADETWQRVQSWLAAYAFGTGIGLRIVHFSDVPEYRRFYSISVGEVERLVELAPQDALESLASKLRADPVLAIAVRGLNESLCEAFPARRLTTLWSTVGDVFGGSGTRLLDDQEWKAAEEALRPLLLDDKYQKVKSHLGGLNAPTSNDALACNVARWAVLAGYPPESVRGRVRECAEARGRAAHTLAAPEGLLTSIRFLQDVLVAYIGETAGLPRR